MISYTNIASLTSTRFKNTSVDYIPQIVFDDENGLLKISGESYHEYAIEFFQPVFDWLQGFIDNHPRKKLTLEFRMSYFNTSTSRRFLEIFDLLETHFKAGGDVAVNWYYEAQDMDMMDSGCEYASNCSFDFQLLAY